MDDSIHQGNKWFKYRIHGWLKSVDDERMDYVPSKRSSKSSSKDFSKKQTSFLVVVQSMKSLSKSK